MTAKEVIERLDEARIANARINEVKDVWEHVQLKERGRWTEVDTSVGKIPALFPPGIPLGVSAQMGPVPSLGQHTDAILSELGYDDESIRRLRQELVI